MFFCLNLVFATSNTRVIKENNQPDIILNLDESAYVYTDAVIDPETKGNINTYIIKDNLPISFGFANVDIDSSDVRLQSYYHGLYNNKNITIRCYEKKYQNGTVINVVPMQVYQLLRATNRLDGCLFILKFTYRLKDNENPKNTIFAFKIVSDREYKMYEGIETVKKWNDDSGEIKRPRKPVKED